jgi:hypothetical protein
MKDIGYLFLYDIKPGSWTSVQTERLPGYDAMLDRWSRYYYPLVILSTCHVEQVLAAVTTKTCIQEVPGSNLGRVTDCPGFASTTKSMAQQNLAKDHDASYHNP